MVESIADLRPGNLVSLRGREWVMLPEDREDILRLRPLGGTEEDAITVFCPLERSAPEPAIFAPPDSAQHGTLAEAQLLRDAVVLNLRSGAGPFRSFGSINVAPRAYQLVPLLVALKLDPVRLLIADDVGIGKTIEAGLIARELLDRGEIRELTVICPPHLCDQWQRELFEKFNIDATLVRTGTATRLELAMLAGDSIFDDHPFTVVSLDYIKSDKRREEFAKCCPSFVIVDEAHTCVSTNSKTRHLRYNLIRSLADDPQRHMLLLTATPHSGHDTAFHNLLGLIDPKFSGLLHLDKGKERDSLRAQLAQHFIQRRREDIAEWEDRTQFPERQTREITYSLTGEWGDLFNEILSYARGMVDRAEGGTKQQRRMSWWAALALLRCSSSSPDAALAALRTRLGVPEDVDEESQIAHLDWEGARTVMDEVDADDISTIDVNPAGSIRDYDDDQDLQRLIGLTEGLRGLKHDPKIKRVAREVKQLVKDGFRPIVFCRFIATAHYVGAQLRETLPRRKTQVAVVTGELTPDQREERVEDLGKFAEGTPVLVATDCLSEGINLQEHFNAVVHYDLAWNPTRHEQREGRVDRFGQRSPNVRTAMFYGDNNPVDGAVLKVILHKARKIREELGVAVPVPLDMNKVVDAIVGSVLFKRSDLQIEKQLELYESEWQSVKRKARRTIFAHRRMNPADVLPEWNKTRAALGGEQEVERFVARVAERLGAPLAIGKGYCRLPVKHLPAPLRERLAAIDVDENTRFSFAQPPAERAIHVHRVHPLVATLAEYTAEQTLGTWGEPVGARATAIRTKQVEVRTVLYLLRLRCQIVVESWVSGGRYGRVRSLLAEECVGVEMVGDGVYNMLSAEETLACFERQPHENLHPGQKQQLIQRAIDDAATDRILQIFERVAHDRANAVAKDHKRVRDASRLKRLRYRVRPSLPADILGVYVFLPVPRGFS